MKRGRITNEKLRSLCIKNNWFTEGTNTQYEKLFYMNDMGASNEQIATAIWLCSDAETWCRRDIICALDKAGFTARDEISEAEHFKDWLGI